MREVGHSAQKLLLFSHHLNGKNGHAGQGMADVMANCAARVRSGEDGVVGEHNKFTSNWLKSLKLQHY